MPDKEDKRPRIRIVSAGPTCHDTQIVIADSDVDIARFCRAATIRLDVNEINTATLEMVAVDSDIGATLTDVKIIHVCDRCKEEIAIQDVSGMKDSLRRYESANA